MKEKLTTKQTMTQKKFDFKKGAVSSIKGKPTLKVGQYHVH